MFSKYKELRVPRGAVDNNLPANEGNMDSIPLPGGCQKPQSNYAPVLQLLTHALLEPMLCNKRSPHSEEPEHHNEEQSLLAATREKPAKTAKTQWSQK